MASLNSICCQTSYSLRPFSCLNYPLFSYCFVTVNPQRRPQKYRKITASRHLCGFVEVRRDRKFGVNFDSSWCCCCKQSERDVELEEEILDFMEKSEKPTMFPTKEELVKAGRMDLVEAIKSRGGWYSLGWNEDNVGDIVEEAMDFDIEEFHQRVEIFEESTSLRASSDNSFTEHGDKECFAFAVESYSGDLNALQPVSSSSLGRPLEIGAGEYSGIEGILSRLEEQRNSDFGIHIGKYRSETKTKATSKVEVFGGHLDTFIDADRIDLGETNRLASDSQHKIISNITSGKIRSNSESETWRSWSNQQAGFHHGDFEAAEISFSRNQTERDKDALYDGVIVSTEECAKTGDRYKEINHSQIRLRLQHLEAELTTTLRSLRSKCEDSVSQKVNGSSSDLHNLSDAWEFQENEFMSAQEKLRSIRANLAVLEGKMALAIIDAQKLIEEKQKRINGARKALNLLRTTCIVWPNSASEVLLAGSFDGWTTQRKMDELTPGIFSLFLKLYPGKYEIKFIVDGVWQVDPLRPIVNNNGYQNNLLLVT